MSEGGVVLSLLCLASSLLLDFVFWRVSNSGTTRLRPQAEFLLAHSTIKPARPVAIPPPSSTPSLPLLDGIPPAVDALPRPFTMRVPLAIRRVLAGLPRGACVLAALGLLMLSGMGEIAVLTGVVGAVGARLAAVIARARSQDLRVVRAVPMVYSAFLLVLLCYVMNGVLQSPGAEGDLFPMQGCTAGVLLERATRYRRDDDRRAARSARLFVFCVCAVALGMLISSLRIPVFASACVFPLVLASATCLAAVVAMLCEGRILPVALWHSRHAPAFLLSAVLSAGLFWVLVFLMLPGNHAAIDGSSYPLRQLWWALLSGEALAALVLLARQRAGVWHDLVRWGCLGLLALLLATLCAGSLGALLAVLAALVVAAPWIGVV